VVEHLTNKTNIDGLNPAPGIGMRVIAKLFFVKKKLSRFSILQKFFQILPIFQIWHHHHINSVGNIFIHAGFSILNQSGTPCQ
jgi:hypothetical protein